MKAGRIHFIITGGTIDKSYDPATEVSVANKTSVIPHYINDIIKPHFKASFKVLFLKDSGEINESMRGKILRAVKTAQAKKIVIVHGTTTMTKTADYLGRNLDKDLDKAVVLTGAMIPLKELAMSDGGFNLGFAIAAMENLKPGVYIAMNGQVFAAGAARKNVKKARFVPRA